MFQVKNKIQISANLILYLSFFKTFLEFSVLSLSPHYIGFVLKVCTFVNGVHKIRVHIFVRVKRVLKVRFESAKLYFETLADALLQILTLQLQFSSSSGLKLWNNMEYTDKSEIQTIPHINEYMFHNDQYLATFQRELGLINLKKFTEGRKLCLRIISKSNIQKQVVEQITTEGKPFVQQWQEQLVLYIRLQTIIGKFKPFLGVKHLRI